ncbi:glycosyltransferase family 39 protein [Coraliomargarita akajimensis]|nr:glycosyltransferase family 39 protein [Coraliomargarita akajimensis]
MEAVMWGSEWQWGYDKHPPLSGWAAQLAVLLMGDPGVYLLSQLCIVTAGLGILAIAVKHLGYDLRTAVLSVVLLDCVYFFTYNSVEFNVNMLQLPFWAWGWYCGIDGLQNRRWLSWVGLGVCVALGALTKYIAVFLLIPLFSWWLLRGELFKALRSPGLYVAGVVSILLFAPHLLWMREHDWITITYGMRRTGSEDAALWQYLWHPLEFALTQVGIALVPLLVVLFVRLRGGRSGEVPKGVLGISFGAYLFLTALSLVTAIRPVTVWAAPFALGLGLWIVPKYRLDQRGWLLPASFGMGGVALVAYTIVYGMGPIIREKPHRVNYPGAAIAQAVEAAWQAAGYGELEYVIADEWLGGMVNRYGASHASLMIRGDLTRSAYLSEEAVHQRGAMVLWLKARDARSDAQSGIQSLRPDLLERFPQMEPLEDLVIDWPRRRDSLQGRYGLALIPPGS